MFPSWHIRFQQPLGGSSKSGEGSTDSGSAVNTESPISRKLIFLSTEEQVKHGNLPPLMQSTGGVERGDSVVQQLAKQNPEKKAAPEANTDKSLDAKSLKRLAQNREAAKRSRLRKKVYVQQLESSRLRLAQLEQDLHRARPQAALLGGGGFANVNASSGGAMFDMEYARWLDDDHRQITELRTALHANISDCDLRVILNDYISHYDELFRLKGIVAKSDVLHLITGNWTTPVERCFLWLGGFRPSDLIKILIAQLDPLSEQQVVGIYSLQQSSLQAEDALSQGLEQLLQSVIDTIANTASIAENMHYVYVALGKIANLEGFLRQADNLRQQTLHQLRRMLTARQVARCFLIIGEYNGRMRTLSSLWASRLLE